MEDIKTEIQKELRCQLSDFLDKVYKKGFEKGTEHSQPSIKTMGLFENLQKDIDYIKANLDEIKSDFVRKEEFTPVKSLVYGLVSLILVSFIGAIIALILK